MKHAALIALAILGSCSSPQEQPRFPGVRTRLVLLDPAPAVGTPLRIRLDLINDGDTSVLYDAQQCDSNGSIGILGPDGRPVPFVDGPRSTFGSFTELAPRSSVTLIDKRDLTRQYLISKPGRYTIRFSGYIQVVDAGRHAELEKHVAASKDLDYFKELEALQGSVDQPSNEVAVEVRPGTLPEKYIVVEKLLPALPPKWKLAVNWWPPQTEDPEYTLFRPDRKKGDSVIVLRISQGPALQREHRAGEWMGKSVYIRSSADDEKAWPDHERRLLEILNGR